MGCQADRYYGLEQALVQVLAQVLHRRTCVAACNYCNLCCIRSPMLLPVSCAVSWPALTSVLQRLIAEFSTIFGCSQVQICSLPDHQPALVILALTSKD